MVADPLSPLSRWKPQGRTKKLWGVGGSAPIRPIRVIRGELQALSPSVTPPPRQGRRPGEATRMTLKRRITADRIRLWFTTGAASARMSHQPYGVERKGPHHPSIVSPKFPEEPKKSRANRPGSPDVAVGYDASHTLPQFTTRPMSVQLRWCGGCRRWDSNPHGLSIGDWKFTIGDRRFGRGGFIHQIRNSTFYSPISNLQFPDRLVRFPFRPYLFDPGTTALLATPPSFEGFSPCAQPV